MNILYYIPELNQEMGGIRQYAITLLNILALDQDNSYYIFHNQNDPEVAAVLRRYNHLKLVRSFEYNRKNVFSTYADKAINVYNRLSGRRFGKTQLDRICCKLKIDIIHSPSQYLPQSQFAQSICTMHDVQELHYPEFFTPEDRAYRAVNYAKYLKDADAVIVSFEHIKADLVKYFRITADKVCVCLLEMDKLWFDKYDISRVALSEKLEITGDFILYPANTWPHKNHQKLLEALLILKQDGSSNIKIICTGHKTDYFIDHLNPFIEKHKLNDQIIFTGVVDEQTLYSLYKTCLGVVVPTLYEAGSFPLIESILLNVPVICSNVTSLPETIGDQEFVFDPMDALDISTKIKLLWESEGYRQRSIANSKKQTPKLRKTNALTIVKNLYKNCAA